MTAHEWIPTARPRESEVLEALTRVIDPCCTEKGISVVDMGLVRSIDVGPSDDVRIRLLLTSGWCPFAADLVGSVESAAEGVAGIASVTVELTWDEAWSSDRLSDDARRKLRFLPPPRAVDRQSYVASHLGSHQEESQR